MTHTRQSDKVLGTEKSLPHARRSLVDLPVLVLSLARGKKDDHMLETLNIIGFESIMIMVIGYRQQQFTLLVFFLRIIV